MTVINTITVIFCPHSRLHVLFFMLPLLICVTMRYNWLTLKKKYDTILTNVSIVSSLKNDLS